MKPDLLNGVYWFEPVVAVATEPHPLEGLAPVQGQKLEPGDRVLAPRQRDAKDNGVYLAAAGKWARAPDRIEPTSVWLNMRPLRESHTEVWLVDDDGVAQPWEIDARGYKEVSQMHEVRKLAVTVGDGESCGATVMHGFRTRDVIVEVFAIGSYETVGLVATTRTADSVTVEHKWIDLDEQGEPVTHTAPIPKDGWRVVIFA